MGDAKGFVIYNASVAISADGKSLHVWGLPGDEDKAAEVTNKTGLDFYEDGHNFDRMHCPSCGPHVLFAMNLRGQNRKDARVLMHSVEGKWIDEYGAMVPAPSKG